MIILGQEKRGIANIGSGDELIIEAEEDKYAITAWNADIGTYDTEEDAKTILKDIFDSMDSDGSGKYIMPQADKVSEITKKQEENSKKVSVRTYTLPNSPQVGLSIDVSNRLYNVLLRHGFSSPDQIKKLSERELLRIRGIGPQGIEELRKLHLTKESSMEQEAN